MKKLFYSPTEKIIFWIAGYTDNHQHVDKTIEMLQNNSTKFANKVMVHREEVMTDIINESRRYKRMRIFFCKNQKIKPKKAFSIGHDWTMWTWLLES